MFFFFLTPLFNRPSPLVVDYSAPASVVYSKNYAEIKSKLGSRISSVLLEKPIIDYRIEDLDADGECEIIFAIGNESKTEELDVRTYDGKAVFKYSCRSGKIFQGGSSCRYYIRDWMLIGDKKKSLVVHCRDWNGWYQTYIQEINHTGKLIGEYIHPGHLWNPVCSKFNGSYYSVWAGVNNDLSRFESPRTGILFCLKHPLKSGEAPPNILGTGQGSQLWYKILKPDGMEIKKISVVRSDEYGDYFSCWTERGKIFFLSKGGRLLGTGRADNGDPLATLYEISDRY